MRPKPLLDQLAEGLKTYINAFPVLFKPLFVPGDYLQPVLSGVC